MAILFNTVLVPVDLSLNTEIAVKDHPGLRVEAQVLRGYFVQRMITRYAQLLSPDLIIVGRRQDRRWWRSLRGISPRALARRTNCPILTVTPGSVDSRTRIIVIPISDRLPERRLEWGILLAGNNPGLQVLKVGL